MPETPVDTGDSRPRLSVVDAWLDPMSTTVREEYEVGDLDPVGVLEAAAEAEQAERRAAFRKLQLAAHWADLHPATTDTGVETPGGPALLADESLGGDGTPAGGRVHPRTVRPRPGHVPLGRGAADRRRPRPPPPPPLAVETRVPVGGAGLAGPPGRPPDPPPAPRPRAIWVDEQLADRGSCGPVIVDRLVAHAIAMNDPEQHEDREDDARADWDVTLTHPEATDFLGTSHLEATGDTLDAEGVLRPGLRDRPPAVPRRRHLTRWASARSRPSASSPANPPRPASRRSRCTPVSTPATSNPTPSPPVEIEKLGAATLTKIRTWVGHHQVVIQPVLNMARRDAVDSHDPPAWMRDLVILRDGHCIFPRCQVDARSCDLDHIDPLRPERTTRPNPARQPRLPLPATPPRQDHRSLAIPPHARRRLPMARPVRHDLRRHRPRHPPSAPTTGTHATGLRRSTHVTDARSAAADTTKVSP